MLSSWLTRVLQNLLPFPLGFCSCFGRLPGHTPSEVFIIVRYHGDLWTLPISTGSQTLSTMLTTGFLCSFSILFNIILRAILLVAKVWWVCWGGVSGRGFKERFFSELSAQGDGPRRNSSQQETPREMVNLLYSRSSTLQFFGAKKVF